VLSHPNVIALFDAGEHEGRSFLVFEFINGQSLRAEMADRPMNVRRAVELAIQMTDAVADAHAAGFGHGGLSPDSVVVTAKGHAKIPAFELAAREGFDGGGDRLRDYESPEEAKGQPADDRSDIYSVGAILYEMLTTRRPSHKGASAPSVSNRHVIPELDEIVLRAAAPNPESRYQTAVTLASALRGVGARLDVHETAFDQDADAARPPWVARLLLPSIAALVLLVVLWWVLTR
jgi:serine/threonine protein kinase